MLRKWHPFSFLLFMRSHIWTRFAPLTALPQPVKVPGTCGKMDYCSWSSPRQQDYDPHPFLCKGDFLWAEYAFYRLDLANVSRWRMSWSLSYSLIISIAHLYVYSGQLSFIILLNCHNLVSWVLFSYHLLQIRKWGQERLRFLPKNHTSMDYGWTQTAWLAGHVTS